MLTGTSRFAEIRRVSGFAVAGLFVGISLLACTPRDNTDDVSVAASGGTAIEPGAALDRPSYDRSNQKASAQSVARGDLLACRNLDSTFTDNRPTNAKEFAKTLHGTWVNPNMRSVHGRPIDTDAIFLIDMKSDRPASILIDRNNLGKHVLNTAYHRLRMAEGEQSMMSMVNCAIEFVDYYVKISNDVLIDELSRGTGIPMKSDWTMDRAWQALVEGGYFDSFEMRTSARSDDRITIRSQQGDHQRVAITPDFKLLKEADIERGGYPGGEYYMPMITGGLFHITLTDTPAELFSHGGVKWHMDAEYRGVGIGIPPGEAVAGFEEGVFHREGGAFVSGPGAPDQQWATSACADKHNLDGLSQVSNPVGHEGHDHDLLIFERFVIGSPM
ncbi:MAG: hypothetical protein MJA32_02590 [Proteobacteria bacterium]|nr:hypothetical protein [Pseudomonadota bacterium]